jgi:hypothetical protein
MDLTLVKKLKEHIQKELKKKYTPKDIETSLLRAGFDKASVIQAFVELKIKPPSFIDRFFTSKPRVKIPEIKKPVKSKPVVKVEPKKPAKQKESFFSKLFKPEAPTQQKPVKVEPPKKPKVEPRKPAKQKESFFSKLFKHEAKKPTPIKVELPKKVVVQKPKIKTTHKPIKLSFFAKFVTTLLLVIIIMAAIILLFSPASCATKECFLENANACKRATYQNTIAGAQINYESKTDCTIVKTLVKVADTEPVEIKEKFEGKSMICAYHENDFSPMHIETLSGLIVDCEGPLKQELIKYVI